MRTEKSQSQCVKGSLLGVKTSFTNIHLSETFNC